MFVMFSVFFLDTVLCFIAIKITTNGKEYGEVKGKEKFEKKSYRKSFGNEKRHLAINC